MQNTYKIFQIGFNKCGTHSINTLFNEHTNLKAIHWDYGKLSKSMMENFIANKKLLSNKYETYRVFTDMECCFLSEGKQYEWVFAFKYFKKLDEQYPKSKFILNIRNVDDWIASRLNHSSYTILDENSNIISNEYSYLERYSFWLSKKLNKNINKEDLVEIWKSEFEEHCYKVKKYFENRPQDLLVFNIDIDPFEKFSKFFEDIDFSTKKMPFVHKTN